MKLRLDLVSKRARNTCCSSAMDGHKAPMMMRLRRLHVENDDAQPTDRMKTVHTWLHSTDDTILSASKPSVIVNHRHRTWMEPAWMPPNHPRTLPITTKLQLIIQYIQKTLCNCWTSRNCELFINLQVFWVMESRYGWFGWKRVKPGQHQYWHCLCSCREASRLIWS